MPLVAAEALGAPAAAAPLPQSGLRGAFALDLRSLAAFRIALGLLLLTDLGDRARDLSAHYTDAGVLPRSAALAFDGWASLHLLAGGTAGTALLFGVAALAALALTLGLQTRLAMVVSWVMLLSLHHRNPYVTDFGDMTARALTFWAMFLPLGARASLDALARPEAPTPPRVTSLATAAWILQIIVIYGSAAAFKASHPVWLMGKQLWYVLHLDSEVRPFARALLASPRLCAWLTWSTLAVELCAPLLLLVPRAIAPLRLALVLLFFGMHLAFGVVIRLGLFVPFCLALWLPLLPGELWEWCGHRSQRLVQGLARGLGRVARRLPTAPADIALSVPARLVVASALLALEVWTFGQHAARLQPLAAPLGPLLHVVGLDQRWSMFADRTTNDGWWIFQADLDDGRVVDLLTGAPPTREKPADLGKGYRQRWANDRYAMTSEDAPELLPLFAAYLCRRWEAEHPRGPRLRQLQLRYMLEVTTLAGEEPPVDTLRWAGSCVPGR